MNLREVEGLSKGWLYDIRYYLTNYLDFVRWTIDEDTSLEYFKKLKEEYTVTSYRKQVYQIRRFLTYLGIEWAKNIRLPPEPEHKPKRVTADDIRKTLDYFRGSRFYIQIKALILLGATSGMRAEEMYQLRPEDIDLDNRTVYINHNPEKGQSTKTRKSRMSFFNREAQEALREYLTYFEGNKRLKRLFPKHPISKLFRNAPIKVKDLRKFFSQEWDRRGGPTSIKKILMGHSLKNDVDLMHYNNQSEDDLKIIYDKVMSLSVFS